MVANNYSYDNIIAGTRNEWNKEKRALTDEQCRMIRKEHDEPYSFVNSRGITVNYGQTPYLVLAKRYNCSKSTIYNVLNGEYPKQHKKRGKKNES